MNAAAEYNRVRRIVFSTINKAPAEGCSMVRGWIDNYYRKGALDELGRKGLLAEVDFYEQHRIDYKLRVACDVGDHVDFVGERNGKIISFDVTTNLGVKKISEYRPFILDGFEYEIALATGEGFDMVNARLLSLDRCTNCDRFGFRVPFVLMGDEYITRMGMSTGEYVQRLCWICPYCQSCEVIDEWTLCGMCSISAYYRELASLSGEDEQSLSKEVFEYGKSVLKYFRENKDGKILAVAEPFDFNQDLKHGEPIPALSFRWKHPIVESLLQDCECDTSIIDDMH